MKPYRSIYFLYFIVCMAAGIALLTSWLYVPDIRSWWDIQNAKVFFSFNGWVAENRLAQVFWAVANNRLFDLVAGGAMIGLFYLWIIQLPPEQRVNRLAVLIYFLIAALITVAFAKKGLNMDSISPTGVLKPAYRLSELVSWAKPKDYSNVSFPGDHGTVLLLASAFLLYYAGLHFGLAMLIVALFCMMPRLVSGAHWLTDNAVGSLSCMLMAVALFLFTPLQQIAHPLCLKFLRIPLIARLTKLFLRIDVNV